MSKRDSTEGIWKLNTDNLQIVHFNLQFIPIKRISYKKGCHLYKIRIFPFIKRTYCHVLPCQVKTQIAYFGKNYLIKIGNPVKGHQIISFLCLR